MRILMKFANFFFDQSLSAYLISKQPWHQVYWLS